MPTHNHRLELFTFSVLAVAALALNFFIFLPYFEVLFLIGIFTILFYPIFRYFLRVYKGREALAAITTVALVLVCILLPATGIGILIFQEALDVYNNLSQSPDGSFLSGGLSSLERTINNILPTFRIEVDDYLRQGLGWLVRHVDSIFSGVIKTVFGFFLLALGLFYSLKDSSELKRRLLEVTPLDHEHSQLIINKLGSTIIAVVRGFLVVAIIQGLLVGVGFGLFGIPNPVLWGVLASIAALIPSIGTALITVPAILYLFFSGNLIGAGGLLVWAVAAVGLVDNILGPVLMKRGTRIHPFVILLSVLGGIGFFGPIGFLAGPVAVSLLLALFEVSPLIVKSSP